MLPPGECMGLVWMNGKGCLTDGCYRLLDWMWWTGWGVQDMFGKVRLLRGFEKVDLCL